MVYCQLKSACPLVFLWTAIALLIVASLLLLLVLFDTFVYLSHRKHRRITTFTYECQKLVWWHYVLLLMMLLIGFTLGKFI
jgi:H+/Cl- antiporter ClcA